MKKKGLLAPAAVALAAAATFGVGAPALASSPHNGPLQTNNGCSWDGYHNYSSSSARADTEKKGGNCVEVHVRMAYNGTSIQDWDSSKAAVSVSGTITFNYSDHNADPLGTPPYVGYRLY